MRGYNHTLLSSWAICVLYNRVSSLVTQRPRTGLCVAGRGRGNTALSHSLTCKTHSACCISNHYPSPFSKVLSTAWMSWYSGHYPEISERKVWFLALVCVSFVTMCKLRPKGNMLGCKRILNLEDKVLTRVSGWKPGKFKRGKRCTFIMEKGINSQNKLQRWGEFSCFWCLQFKTEK